MNRYGNHDVIRQWVSGGNLHVYVVDAVTREVSHQVIPLSAA